MELLTKTNAVRLRSHLDKYLTADDDRLTIRQSRINATTPRSIWLIEPSSTSSQTVRLRNQHTGLYLFASDEPFLLGWTGKRVIQSPPVLLGSEPGSESGFIWEVIRDGFQVKLKTWKDGGKLLRGNGGTPPWRNTVTHDVPVSGATGNWILWDVESVVDGGNLSPLSSIALSEVSFDYDDDEQVSGSPLACRWSPKSSMKKTGMDFFTNAKAVRLRSIHGKYLTAEEDEESVKQDRTGSSRNARWTVESVLDNHQTTRFIRLKSCYGKYLTASDHPFLLGMTGRQVTQTHLPRGGRQPPSSLEWEPVPENAYGGSNLVKLKTRHGNFLRANTGLPPWRNSVTHDVPYRSSTQEWILWHVDVVEILDHVPDTPQLQQRKKEEVMRPSTPPPVYSVAAAAHVHSDSFSSDGSFTSPTETESAPAYHRHTQAQPPKLDGGRLIYYHIADEYGNVINDDYPGYSLTFKGKSVEELTRILEEETGLPDIIVCTRSPLNRKLYPLRLHLPPNNATMHIVLVESSSRVAMNFEAAGLF